MGAVTVDTEIPLWFRSQMARLMGLKFIPASLVTHWEALQAFSEPHVQAAVTRVIQGNTSTFPAPWVLRAFAERDRGRVSGDGDDRSVELPSPIQLGTLPTGTPILARRTWRYYCDDCSDSGMRSMWCGARYLQVDEHTRRELAKPWQDSQDCGRTRDHGPHEWVKPCACAPTNPDIRRRLERHQHSGGTRGETE